MDLEIKKSKLGKQENYDAALERGIKYNCIYNYCEKD